jgi:hypothetical protein
MTSEAGVMSKPVSRGTPSAAPPRPMTVRRSARSFTSITRRQSTRRDVDAELVAVVEVVVEHRGQQVVGRGDGVEVAGEVEVDLLAGTTIELAAAGGAALQAEGRPERRLAQRQADALADRRQPLGEADRDVVLPSPARSG